MVVFHHSVNFNSVAVDICSPVACYLFELTSCRLNKTIIITVVCGYHVYAKLLILKAWRINIKTLRCAIAIQACKSIAKES